MNLFNISSLLNKEPDVSSFSKFSFKEENFFESVINIYTNFNKSNKTANIKFYNECAIDSKERYDINYLNQISESIDRLIKECKDLRTRYTNQMVNTLNEDIDKYILQSFPSDAYIGNEGYDINIKNNFGEMINTFMNLSAPLINIDNDTTISEAVELINYDTETHKDLHKINMNSIKKFINEESILSASGSLSRFILESYFDSFDSKEMIYNKSKILESADNIISNTDMAGGLNDIDEVIQSLGKASESINQMINLYNSGSITSIVNDNEIIGESSEVIEASFINFKSKYKLFSENTIMCLKNLGARLYSYYNHAKQDITVCKEASNYVMTLKEHGIIDDADMIINSVLMEV